MNGVTAWLFASGRKDDINLRSVFAHMGSDALVSLGVVAVGLIILVTGWFWLDPIVSLAINAIIVWGTWGLLREAVEMSLAAVPTSIDPSELRGFLEAQSGVSGVHDLHVWPMSTTEVALTCHLVMPSGHSGDEFVHRLAEQLAARFKIDHPTLQIETDPVSRARWRPITSFRPLTTLRFCMRFSPPYENRRKGRHLDAIRRRSGSRMVCRSRGPRQRERAACRWSETVRAGNISIFGIALEHRKYLLFVVKIQALRHDPFINKDYGWCTLGQAPTKNRSVMFTVYACIVISMTSGSSRWRSWFAV